MKPAPLLAIAALLILPAAASAQTQDITDSFARGAARAMIATRLGIGTVGVQRQVFDLRCHRVDASAMRCTWALGPDGGRLVAYGKGTVSIVAAERDAPARYRYDYTGDIGHRVDSGATYRYRERTFRWHYTSPDKAAFAHRITQRFQAAADAAITGYYERSGATGSPEPNAHPCVWSLLDDRTVTAACSAAYDVHGASSDCRVSLADTWAEGTFIAALLDTSGCDAPPG